jgi:hypothetical protein
VGGVQFVDLFGFGGGQPQQQQQMALRQQMAAPMMMAQEPVAMGPTPVQQRVARENQARNMRTAVRAADRLAQGPQSGYRFDPATRTHFVNGVAYSDEEYQRARRNSRPGF